MSGSTGRRLLGLLGLHLQDDLLQSLVLDHSILQLLLKLGCLLKCYEQDTTLKCNHYINKLAYIALHCTDILGIKQFSVPESTTGNVT